MTRNEDGRQRQSVQDWLAALENAAAAFAPTVAWSPEDRYLAVIEVRIPWRADIDNYIKDILDCSARQGVFGGQDERVDLVHAIKQWGIARGEAGARIEIWLVE
jgi:Holliday junction resolvase RusA-like endonuclease